MYPSSTKQFPPGYLQEDRGGALLATAITFLVIETLAIVLLFLSRYYARGDRTNRSMEIFMTMAYIVCCGKVTLAILMVKIGGAGHHKAALPLSTISTGLKLSTVSQILCPSITSFSKLGILCILRRILNHLGRRYRIVINITFALVLLTMITQILIPFVNCRPFSYTWKPWTSGSCAIPGLLLWRYISAPNVLTTLIMIAIPVPALSKLHVSRPVKLGLGAVFCVCIMGVVAALMRLHAFLKVTNFNDITYENINPYCWTIAEAGIYLVAGVMLTLRPLLEKIFKDTRFERWLSASSGHSASSNSRMFGRKWYHRKLVTISKTSKDKQSMSDAMTEGITLVRTKSSKAHTIEDGPQQRGR